MNTNFDRIECTGWKDFARLHTNRVALHIDTTDMFEFYHVYAAAAPGRCWDGVASCRNKDLYGNEFWVIVIWDTKTYLTSSIGRWGGLVETARDLIVLLHQLVNGPHEFAVVVDIHGGPMPG